MYITASVFVNDDEQGLHADHERWLEELAPHEPIERYLHNRTGEDSGDAHLKRQVMGREVTVAVPGGQPAGSRSTQCSACVLRVARSARSAEVIEVLADGTVCAPSTG